MKVKSGFSLLEVTISILVLGLTVTALLNLLEWSNIKYRSISTDWKERACLTEARTWLRDKITNNEETALNLDKINESLNCPEGYKFNELSVIMHDKNTYFVKLGVYEDRNHNGIADNEEITARLFCFRRRSA